MNFKRKSPHRKLHLSLQRLFALPIQLAMLAGIGVLIVFLIDEVFDARNEEVWAIIFVILGFYLALTLIARIFIPLFKRKIRFSRRFWAVFGVVLPTLFFLPFFPVTNGTLSVLPAIFNTRYELLAAIIMLLMPLIAFGLASLITRHVLKGWRAPPKWTLAVWPAVSALLFLLPIVPFKACRNMIIFGRVCRTQVVYSYKVLALGYRSGSEIALIWSAVVIIALMVLAYVIAIVILRKLNIGSSPVPSIPSREVSPQTVSPDHQSTLLEQRPEEDHSQNQ